jgi:hypothetical protein
MLHFIFKLLACWNCGGTRLKQEEGGYYWCMDCGEKTKKEN